MIIAPGEKVKIAVKVDGVWRYSKTKVDVGGWEASSPIYEVKKSPKKVVDK